jgi:tight adherence protein C
VIALLLLGMLLVALCAALVGHAVALPRRRAIERIDQIAAYGFSAHDPGTESSRAVMRSIERLAAVLGSFFADRVRGLSEADARRELISAGMYRVSPITLIGYRVLAAIALPATVLWFGSTAGLGAGMVALSVPLTLAVGWLAPVTIVRRRARFRLGRIDYELPELVDLLVVTVEAGLGFSGSMQIAAERFGGPLGEELRLTLQEQAMGLPTDQALANMLGRAETDGMRSLVRSVRQGESLGVSIGQIMRNLAEEMRQRRRAAAEERAQKAPIKILFPLVALIFPALFVVILGPALLSFLATLGGAS